VSKELITGEGWPPAAEAALDVLEQFGLELRASAPTPSFGIRAQPATLPKASERAICRPHGARIS